MRPSHDPAPSADPWIDAVRAVANGEEAALRKLYDALAPRVLGIAQQIVRDDGAAEDVVIEVFSQVWRQAGRHDPRKGSVATWIVTMARTRAIDVRRRRQRHARQELELQADEHPGLLEPFPSPFSAASDADHADIIRRELARLPGEQRSVIEAAFFRGLSHSEIAAASGAPLGTVKTRIRSGLSALRVALGTVDGGTA